MRSKKVSDYNERSSKIAEICANDKALLEARAEIFKDLIGSVRLLKKLRNDSSDPSIQLQAVKHHLKLAGLEIDRSESKKELVINITAGQAEKIQQAEKIMRGVE